MVALRWPLVALWLAGAVAALLYLPGFGAAKSNGGGLGELVPLDAQALRTQQQVVKRFGFPLISRVAVVEHDPHGLGAVEQARLLVRAARLDAHALPGFDAVAGALPVSDALGIFPGARTEGQTAVTYLFFHGDVGPVQRVAVARKYAALVQRESHASFVGVTGAFAARHEQGTRIDHALPWVEASTVLLVLLVLGWTFRSAVAPFVAVGSAVIAFEVATHLIGWAGTRFGLGVTGELEPLVVVLLVGIMTDYSIFYLVAFRRRFGRSGDARDAAQGATTEVAGIVAVAALTVAAGVATILLSRLGIFRRLGPGLAIAVVVGFAVGTTFLPALVAVLGRAALWPAGLHRDDATTTRASEPSWRRRAAAFGVRRPVAAVTALLGIAALGAAAWPLQHAAVGVNLIQDLPASAGAARAARAASSSFPAGIVAPTEVLVTGPQVRGHDAALSDLQHRIGRQPGVGAVIGPDQVPLPVPVGIMRARGGRAARFVVVLRDDPYGAHAIQQLHRLEARLPRLLRESGLPGARVGVAGDTALAGTIVNVAFGDLLRVGAVAIAVDLVLLGLFLRAVVAPLILLLTSALVVLVALSAAAVVATALTGAAGMTFYVPFAVTILLLSLGSDYNVFVVGEVWESARTRPLREAIVDGGVRASAALPVAGVILALGFGLLVVVPLGAFRQFALAMLLGVLVDTFFVRPVLVPALLSLFGSWAAWPNRQIRSSQRG